jgi:hypothetical protein
MISSETFIFITSSHMAFGDQHTTCWCWAHGSFPEVASDLWRLESPLQVGSLLLPLSSAYGTEVWPQPPSFMRKKPGQVFGLYRICPPVEPPAKFKA